MKGFYLATNVLALIGTVVLVIAAIVGPMSWWVALLGAFVINLVAVAYTMDEDKGA